MRVMLYCYRSGVINNSLGIIRAGVIPRPIFTSPRLTAETFPYAELEKVDVAYICLHGLPNIPSDLFGDNMVRALTVKPIRHLKLNGLKVILEGCYGLATNFPQAFLDAGAAFVIGSKEPTQDYLMWLGDAGKVGSDLLRRVIRGEDFTEVLTDSVFALVGREDKGVLV